MSGKQGIRIASHVHSDWSYDAKWTLEELASAFVKRGYRVVLMTEHDKGYDEQRRQDHRAACARASSDQILMMPGIEYSDADNTVHVLVWGDVPFAGEGVPTLELLKHVAEHKGVAVLAHPTRKNAWRRVKPEWIKLLAGVELWNRKSDGWCISTDGANLIAETGLAAWVGLDFHRSRQFFPLAMTMQLEDGVSLTESIMIEAIREGTVVPKALGVRADQFEAGFLGAASRFADKARRSVLRMIRRK
ncbi:MAG: hypothetical protein H6815_06285 [Phycisphaeraceae bacterium]|nr:hypothetical protein [Phycisphaerales bacterium]MCB9860047.1 hypothetical protein [Phycisphaeraceae bacterium]